MKGDVDRRVGMAIFLGSWAMLFCALFFSYGVLRQNAMVWPPPGTPRLPVWLPLVSTAAIALSSLFVEGRRIGAGAAAGALFLCLQGRLFFVVYQSGLTPGSGAYGSVFYTFTGFHALHVIVGVAALLSLWVRRRPAGLWRAYWHFVGAIWLLLFLLVFVP